MKENILDAGQKYVESLQNIHKEEKTFLEDIAGKKGQVENEYKKRLLRELKLEGNYNFSSYYLEGLLKFCQGNNADASFLIQQLYRAEYCAQGRFVKRKFYGDGLPPQVKIATPQTAEDYYFFAMEVLDTEAYGNNARRNFVARLLEKASELAAVEEEEAQRGLPQSLRQRMSVAYKFLLNHLDHLYHIHSQHWLNNY